MPSEEEIDPQIDGMEREKTSTDRKNVLGDTLARIRDLRVERKGVVTMCQDECRRFLEMVDIHDVMLLPGGSVLALRILPMWHPTQS